VYDLVLTLAAPASIRDGSLVLALYNLFTLHSAEFTYAITTCRYVALKAMLTRRLTFLS